MTTYVSAVRDNILIVNDKPEDLLMLKGYLSTIECNIITAKSVKEALACLQKNEFAFLILDLKTMELDDLITAGIPMIFIVSNRFDQGSLFKEYELGIVDFLTRPIEPVILRSKVRVFLNLYQQNKLLKKQTQLLEINVKELLELKELNCHLESLSSLDGLTGIPNRRYFDQTIKHYWKNAVREHQPLSLLMIDIDDFKAYNDTFGHLQGDDCLMLVAKTITSSLNRPNDFAARYGGEEFTAVLPNTDKKGAFHIAERIRKNIENLAIKHPTSRVADYVTISIGVARIIPQASDSIADFVNNADNALYMAKQLGRNKVHMGNLSRIKTIMQSSQKNVMLRSFRDTIAGLWL